MDVETPAPATTTENARWWAGLNRNVIVLGVVSLFTDISSEMLVPIRFLFLVNRAVIIIAKGAGSDSV